MNAVPDASATIGGPTRPAPLLPSLGTEEAAFLGRAAAVASARRRRGGGSTGNLPAGVAGDAGLPLSVRDYSPGMDLRRLDWKRLARTDRPHVSVPEREAAHHLTLLLDASASSGQGSADPRWTLAREVAALLAWLALHEGHDVRLVVEPGPGPVLLRGLHRVAELAAILARLEPTGTAEPARAALRALGEPSAARGRVALVSDLLWPRQTRHAALSALGRASGGAALVHIVQDADEDPARRLGPPGVVRAVDAETGAVRSLAHTPDQAEAWRVARRHFRAELDRDCRAHGVLLVALDAEPTRRVPTLLRAAATVG